MGVKGLQYYIEQHCPEVCKYVSIERLAQEHRMQYNSQPVIAVDGMSLIYPLYSNSLEWIYGGQWLQFVQKLEIFIKRFSDVGIRLVFFFDGTVCSNKRKEWVKRRVNKYKQISSVFWNIKTHHTEPDKKFFQLPTSMGTLTRFALKELGAEVYQTDREADEVISNYAARSRDVFAILSQDSDFLIHNTKLYLSLTHLDLNTLMTIHYDRNCLAFNYLHLHVTQLPLFACLVGNDIISSDKLKQFHQRISEQQGRTSITDITRNLVALILSERWVGDFNNKVELDNISLKVFGNLNGSRLIFDGLRSYALGYINPPPSLCIHLHPDFERAVYDRHINCLNGPFIFNLLCNMEYESSEVLEDSSSIPSALTFRKIRQRCYGVLFNSFQTYSQKNTPVKSSKNILIKEWCAYQGNFMERPECVEPLPLELRESLETDIRIPTVELLWFRSTELEKLKLFWSILQVPLKFELLCTLPKHLIVLCCILNYLIGACDSGPEIKPWEVAVFIAQALWRKTVAELQTLVVPWVDATAVHLSTLIMRGVTTALMVLGTCGYPIDLCYAMPWRFFDGKLFHFLYVKSKERRSVSQLCRNQEELIKEFYMLLPIVTNNTAYAVDRVKWKHILDDFEEHRAVVTI